MFLFLGSKPEVISGYTDNWMYHLPKALSKHGEVQYFPTFNYTDSWLEDLILTLRTNNISAVIGINNYFSKHIPIEVVRALCANYKGLVMQTTSTDSMFEVNKFGVINLCVNFTGKHLSNNYNIGWAYDNKIFYYQPQEQHNKLRVFVDHSASSSKHIDYSLHVYLALRESNIPMEVRTLTNNGIEDVDLDNINIKPFNNKLISIHEFAEQLRWADIFCATHSQILGLPLLEAAACGALPVVMEQTIPSNMINTIYNHTYRRLDITKVLLDIDKKKVSTSTQPYSWDALALRVYNIILLRRTKC